MKVYHSGTDEFEQALSDLIHRGEEDVVVQVEASVKEILSEVRESGDDALLKYTERFDGVRLARSEIALPNERLEQALGSLDPETREALQLAHKRIREFHARQVPSSWEIRDEAGNLLGQKITPLDRVGVYVPGGKAAYPSSVLMNVVPAQVAGVKEIIAVTPPTYIQKNPSVLAAAKLSGVHKVYQVGGAQAIAALAYGTESIPRVDKIVGPGNLYVATAKRLVFGIVDIDMIAGPSEILILTDGSAEPEHLAADLLAQAEHDEQSVPLLISTSEPHLQKVIQSLEKLTERGVWKEIATQAIQNNGKAFVVTNMEEAIGLANRIAPEHLELAFKDAERFLPEVRHAGAIFLGTQSAETLGDYVAGPNHVLPTMGTARFFSPLGAYDFIKRSSILQISQKGLDQLGPAASHLAKMEGLFAHAQAVDMRLKGK